MICVLTIRLDMTFDHHCHVALNLLMKLWNSVSSNEMKCESIQRTVTGKHHRFSNEVTGDDQFDRQLVVWDVQCPRTDHNTGIGFCVIHFVL